MANRRSHAPLDALIVMDVVKDPVIRQKIEASRLTVLNYLLGQHKCVAWSRRPTRIRRMRSRKLPKKG